MQLENTNLPDFLTLTFLWFLLIGFCSFGSTRASSGPCESRLGRGTDSKIDLSRLKTELSHQSGHKIQAYVSVLILRIKLDERITKIERFESDN